MSDATRVAIVGLGAIGGSAALKLLSRGVTPRGFAADATDRELAAVAGVHVGQSVEDVVGDADLVLLAVPIDQLAVVGRRILAAAPTTATVLHAASLQRPAATGFDELLRDRIIGSHPLAGTASAGFAAATEDMFKGSTVYAEPRGTRRNREDLELFWSMAGATRVQYLDAADHDDRMAAVSHIPQLLATALASVLARSSVSPTELGPGGRDMTRLAGSSWSMWAPLLAETPERTSALLEQLADEITLIRSAIESRRTVQLESVWNRASEWRDGGDR